METINKKYNFLQPIRTSNLKRLGRNGDGGYVVDYEIIKKTKTLITFGLGPDWSFELDYIKIKKDIKIYMITQSVAHHILKK